MVEKTFCDKCDLDITGDLQYQLELYDSTAEKELVKKDLCNKCAKAFLKSEFGK